MYYDTLKEAIESSPEATHILTTGKDWPKNTYPNLTGKYAATRLVDGSYWAYRGDYTEPFIIGDRAWVVIATIASDKPIPSTKQIAAPEFLERGAKHMRDRASQRDAPDGERSMGRCVAAFNALEGTNLTEEQGWRFMVLLKYARSVNGDFVADDYEDMAAYAALAGECGSLTND